MQKKIRRTPGVRSNRRCLPFFVWSDCKVPSIYSYFIITCDSGNLGTKKPERQILKKGSEKAEKIAAQTLKEVKDSMQINYFDDVELIKAQQERFKEN